MDAKKAHMRFARACGKEMHGQDVTFNPPVSKAQARMMGAIAGGRLKKKSLSPEDAREFLRGSHTKELPERAERKRR